MARGLPLALVCIMLSSCTLAARGELKKAVRKAERRLARQTKNDGLGATAVDALIFPAEFARRALSVAASASRA